MALGKKTGGRNFKKGVVSNPNGRPKSGESMTDVLKSMVDKDEIAAKLIQIAKKGNFAALKYVYDRIDGMPKQAVEHSGDAANPMSIKIHIQGIDAADDTNPE